jgi:uncharacterized delta-60 repeat protein
MDPLIGRFPFHRLLLTLAATLAVLLAVSRTALAADVVFGFDDSIPLDQYGPLGVEFGDPPLSALPPTNQIPYLWPCTAAISSPPAGYASQVLGMNCRPEAPTNYNVFATLTTFRQRIAVTVGSMGSVFGTQVTFQAFDIDGALIGQAQSPVLAPAGTARLEIDATSPTIAFFVAISNDRFWLDDLTLGELSTQPPPDFIFGPLSQIPIAVSQDSSTQINLSLTRLNGSNGSISLAVNGLPRGVTASLQPTALDGTQTSATLVLSADESAALATTGQTVTGTPLVATAGTKQRSDAFLLEVTPAFAIYGGGEADVAPCTPNPDLGFAVRKPPGSGDVALAVMLWTSGAPTGLPAGLQATIDPPVSGFTRSWMTSHTLTVTAAPGSLPRDTAFVIQGTSGTRVFYSDPFVLHPLAATIDTVSAQFGRTPQALQPGSTIILSGQGFCPGGTVHFGNDQAVATPTSLTNDRIVVEVPRLATSGYLSVTGSGPQDVVWPSSFTVDSYRNWNGFKFHNYTPHITFDQLTTAFGSDQTYDELPLCIFDCSVSFRDPLAMAVNAIANAFFDRSDGGGACFGFSLASQRFDTGLKSRADFPPGALINYDLGTAAGPSGPLREYINAQQVVQASEEFLGHYVDRAASQSVGHASDVISEIRGTIRDALSNGEFPLVAIRDGLRGHVVIAYDLEDVGPSEYFIDIYNSNVEYQASEDSNGALHRQRVEQSRIHMAPDGTWGLPDPDPSKAMNGGLGEIVVTRASQIPTNPTLPGVALVEDLAAGAIVLLASATDASPAAASAPVVATQIEDGSGHALFDAAGNLSVDPATRLRAAPFAPLVGSASNGPWYLVDPSTASVSVTWKGTATAPYAQTVLSPGLLARVTASASPGSSDRVGFEPAGRLRFSAADADKAIVESLVWHRGAATRSAEVSTTTLAGQGDSLGLQSDGSVVVFQHAGAATSVRIRLSSSSGTAPPATFDSGLFTVGADETLSLAVDDWSTLHLVTRTSVDGNGQSTTTPLDNKFDPVSFGQILAVAVAPAAGAVADTQTIVVSSSFDPPPPDSQAAIAWVVRNEQGVVVAHGSVPIADADLHAGARADTLSFPTPAPGRYTAKVDLVTVSLQGLIQIAHTSSMSATFEVGPPGAPSAGGCNCNTSGRPGLSWPPLALLAVSALLLRHRVRRARRSLLGTAACLIGAWALTSTLACTGPTGADVHPDSTPPPATADGGTDLGSGDASGPPDPGTPDAGVPTLDAAAPASARIVAGQSGTVNVDVVRGGGFTDPVRVFVNGLPSGVTVDPVTVPPGQTSGTLTFHAAASAALGPVALSVDFAAAGVAPKSLALSLLVQGSPGSPDVTFGPAPGGKVTLQSGPSINIGPHGLAVQADGSIVLCGNVETAPLWYAAALIRLTSVGGYDASFGSGGVVLANSAGSTTDVCWSLQPAPSGALAIAGFQGSPGSSHAFMVGQLTSAGALDPTFGAGTGFVTTPFGSTDAKAYGLVMLPDGALVLAGFGGGGTALARYLADGRLDTAFGSNGTIVTTIPGAGAASSLSVSSSGRLLATVDFPTSFLVVGYTAAGRLDTSYGAGGQAAIDVGGQHKSTATAALAGPDDELIVAGTAKGVTGDADVAVVRLTASGQPDGAFGTGGWTMAHFEAGDSAVHSARRQSDGAILVAGQTPTAGGTAPTVLRFLSDGALDRSFGAGGRAALDAGAIAQAVAVDDLGRIVVATVLADTSQAVVYRLWP